MVAGGERLVGPVGVVSEVVVVAAERCQVAGVGGSTVGPGLAVVEVAVDGRHPTAGKDTGPLAGFDVAALGGGGSAAGNPVVDHESGVGVGQSPPPFRSRLVFCDLAGDVGDDRPIPG